MGKEKHTHPEENKESEQNESTDPVTSPEEVPDSNDEKIDQDFPGYPHYPAKDDILNPENKFEKVDVDMENVSNRGRNIRIEAKDEQLSPSDELVNTPFEQTVETGDDDIEIVPGTEADVTVEDLLLLGDRDQDMDLGEDEQIKSNSSLLDMNGEQLDIPGTELDDENESIGEEDEENNYYSLGGDRHESLEEDRDSF